MMSRKVIVIGASSGMGAEIVRVLALRGDKVVAVARRMDRLKALASECPANSVIPLEHDVAQFHDVPAAFTEACQLLGGLDAVVYAAGTMPEVGGSEFSFEKDRAMIDVNLTGAIAWLNLAATRFQNVGAGTIVGIGSVAGERGRQGQPVYNATKAALKTYLEALRNRLSKHGVKVVTIKPGPTETEMTAHLGLKGMMPAREAAEKIVRLMNSNGEHYLKFTHKVIFAVIRNIPSVIFRRLKI